MDIRQLLQADYLDILFDQRNKRYGGYELRKHYPQRARRAMIMVLLTTAVAFTIPVIASRSSGKTGVVPESKVETVLHTIPKPKTELPKPVIPEQPAPPAPKVATVANPVPEVVPDDLADNMLKPVDSLENRVVGPTTTPPGDEGLASITPPEDRKGGGGGGSAVEGDGKPEIVRYVSIMPEFNGDVMEYLRRNLQYPDEAREIGYEGKVIIQFVVNEDGGISNIEAMKGGGHGLDREAIRVVSAMPKWKPGKENGRAVKVYFVLPVTFALQ